MPSKPNPFSLYDFLGYFTPGAIFIYLLLGFYAHLQPGTDVHSAVKDYLGFDKPELYIPFTLFAYALGHILAFVSSITVERYSIWAVGYPSKYLLGLKNAGYYAISEKKAARIVLRTLTWIALFPVTLWDKILGEWFGFRDLYAKPLDGLLIEALNKKMSRLLRTHAGITRIKEEDSLHQLVEHDFFRYAYHYAVEHAPNHLPKMQNYVALYGFLRTLTLISVFFFWTTLWHLGDDRMSFPVIASLALGASGMSYVLFMGFVKFYRRFSLEALMALAVTYEKL